VNRIELWGRLLQAEIVQGAAPEAGAGHSPWFVRVMLGVAGWFGALFLLIFVGLGLSFIIKNAGAALVVGVFACGIASAIFRKLPENDFAGQFAFAVSLAGQALIVFGIADTVGSKSVAVVGIVVAVMQAALYFLVPNYVHRIWAAASGACALAMALADMGLLAITPALVLVAFAWVWLKEFDFAKQGSLVRAGGYGLALAAVVIAVMHGERSIAWILDQPKTPVGGLIGVWIGAALTGAALLWAVLQLLARESVPLDSAQGKIAMIGAIILAAATLKAPGIGPAAAVLVIGFANGNRVLAGLGILALLGYLSHYYYSLQLTLLEKSGVLASTGIALLAARLLLHRYWPEPKEGESHA
jgi:uncharacterized protein DUF4401